MTGTQTTERALAPRDLALLRALRTSLCGGIAMVALAGTVCAFALAGALWILVDRGLGQGFSPVFVVAPLLAAIVGIAFLGGLRGVRLFRRVHALLLRPEGAVKKVSIGELTGVSRENGRIRYEMEGESFEVWLPIERADTGKIVFERTVRHLEALLHRRVLLEWLAIDGAPWRLLLRVDYPDEPPVVAERVSTEQERRAVALWGDIAYAWFIAMFAMLAVLVAGVTIFAFLDAWPYSRLSGGLLVAALPISAIGAFMWRRTRRWLAIQPRTLTVTGVIAEVLDHTVSIGRYARTQRWYRIGDRLYATGKDVPANDPMACGSRVRMDYVDRSPLGGRILRMERQATAEEAAVSKLVGRP